MKTFSPDYRFSPTPKVLGVILAGGEGRRLWPLTAERAKPAVPFGGTFRIVDFVLSNFVNSGILKIKVLIQYKSDSLLEHLSKGWRLSSMADHYVEVVPAQQRMGKHWFHGSADAMYQSLNVVKDEDPDLVCVFGGDHIYKMDVRQMLAFHREREAELTVAAVPVPAERSKAFGIIEIDETGRMIGFQEKPEQPRCLPDHPDLILASMGVYVFDTRKMVRRLIQDAKLRVGHQHGINGTLYHVPKGVSSFFPVRGKMRAHCVLSNLT